MAFLAPLQSHAVGVPNLVIDRGDRLGGAFDRVVVM